MRGSIDQDNVIRFPDGEPLHTPAVKRPSAAGFVVLYCVVIFVLAAIFGR